MMSDFGFYMVTTANRTKQIMMLNKKKRNSEEEKLVFCIKLVQRDTAQVWSHFTMVKKFLIKEITLVLQSTSLFIFA